MYGLSQSRSHEHYDHNWQLCRHLFIFIFLDETHANTQAKCTEPGAKFGHSFLLFYWVQCNPAGFPPYVGAATRSEGPDKPTAVSDGGSSDLRGDLHFLAIGKSEG